MNKHTPGPWVFVSKLTASENHRGFIIVARAGRAGGKWALADVQPGDEDGNLGRANARLIAAAPALLKACRQALVALKGREHDQFLRDAIAEATEAE